jgi:teichuronic acid exporter
LDSPPAPPSAQPTEPALSLGHTTARGFAWLLMNTLTIKVVNILQTICLGWLLTDKDYGLVANVFTIGSLSAMIASVAVDDMLVQRQREMNRWATPAFWLSLSLGLAGAAAMTAAGPIASRLYHARLMGLVLVAALAAPLANLGTVPDAMLRAQLRYRTLAVIGWSASITQSIVTVLLAWLGLGPYSILVARTVSTGVQTAAQWCAARPRLRWSLELSQWPSLMGAGAWLMGSRICDTLMSNGSYIALGLLCSRAVTGTFFFAFNLSYTTTTLLVSNVGNVLMPSLCKLQDDRKRQVEVALRTDEALSLLGFPLSFMQAAASAPLLQLIWHDKWLSAIPLLQILSIGMAFQVMGVPGMNLMMAQGRYRTFFFWNLASLLLYFGLVVPGAWWGQGEGAGIAAACVFCVSHGGALYIAIRPAGAGMRDIAKACGAPLIAAAVAVGAAAWIAARLPAMPAGNLIRCAIIGIVGSAIYFPLIRALRPEPVNDLIRRGVALLPARFRTPA